MTDQRPPDAIRDLADRRADARAARDFATADALRAEIEAAGWKVVDAGTDYRLEPAHPADAEGPGGATRYGRTDSVPSRLDEPPSGPATVVVVAVAPVDETLRAVGSLLRDAPAGTTGVVVADGLADADVATLQAAAAEDPRLEVIVTSAPLGHATAVNMGIRRAGGAVVVVADPSMEATGDAIGPLVAALQDPAVAVAGPFGLVSAELRRYAEVEAGDAAAIEAYLQAFRRADAVARGPLDEHFRFYRNLDIWWSLVLRDEGEEAAPRRAAVVPGLPVVRHEHRGWTSVAPDERDRLSKRNFYRIIDRFGDRRDLAVAGGEGSGG